MVGVAFAIYLPQKHTCCAEDWLEEIPEKSDIFAAVEIQFCIKTASEKNLSKYVTMTIISFCI